MGRKCRISSQSPTSSIVLHISILPSTTFVTTIGQPQSMEPPRCIASKIFEPLKIGNGKIELKHRVVLAPLTRNRCVPLSEDTPSSINRIWYPDELVSLYYAQRATKGGLLISEGIAPNSEVRRSFYIVSRLLNIIGKWYAWGAWTISFLPSLWLAKSNASCSCKRRMHICTIVARRPSDHRTFFKHALRCAFRDTARRSNKTNPAWIFGASTVS